MATEEKSEREKTLEMRVAELEDKLSKLQVTEEEMRAYQKVSALMARGMLGAVPGAVPPAASGQATTAPAPALGASHAYIGFCIIGPCIFITACMIGCASCFGTTPPRFNPIASGFEDLGS